MSKDLIRKFIQTEIKREMNSTALKDTDSLFEAGIVDSLSIQLLIAYLEKTFAISILDDEILPDNFETITAIADFVKGKLT